MTRSLIGDWTRDLQHSKPALYHYAIEEAVIISFMFASYRSPLIIVNQLQRNYLVLQIDKCVINM